LIFNLSPNYSTAPMALKPFQFFFRFTREQRKGVAALFILIVLLQAGYFILMSADIETSGEKSSEEKQWLALQSKLDELKSKKGQSKSTIYPFNPNFISDYKGYTLGMSVAQIDRLHAFRKTGKFINSAEDFKDVTKVSDSLLAKISPFFKFPDWVTNKKTVSTATHPSGVYVYKEKDVKAKKENRITVLDINAALEEDLVKVYGIGPAYAKQLLRRRAQFGAFVSMDQMSDFKDFSPEAIQGLKKAFKVQGIPDVTTLNVNTASLKQLTYFPYFNKDIARAIITRRSMKGRLTSIDELLEINDFPVEKLKIIALYLEF
jgi:DNA uptake protein ComE-like DNA-binding protein